MFMFVASSFAWGAASFSTDVEASLARAKQEKRPLLISFFGIWCPPCNELEESVFESAPFLRSAKHFVLLKVDADKPASWTLKDRYHVGGYPTVVFATPQGNEIYRIVGLRQARDFVRTMNWVYDNRDLDLDQACRGRTTESIWHCAFTCGEKGDDGCAEKAFQRLEKHLKPGDFRYHALRTYRVRKLKDEGKRAAGYRELLKTMPKSPFVFVWAAEWVELATPPADAAKTVLTPVLAEYAAVLKHPRLEMVGLVPTDLAEIRADLMEKMGDEIGAKAAWLVAAKMLEALAKQLPKGSAARGYTLERISCLASAGDKAGALALANEYRGRFPDEFTFHFQASNLLKGMGKRDEASEAARAAYKASYGDNRIRSATLLIELLGKEKGKSFYGEVKEQIRPDAQLDVRTHRYLKKLDEAFQKAG